MTAGTVLVLAGLAAGGGEGAGAAAAPVCVSLDGEWEGTWSSASFGVRKTRLRWGGGLWPTPGPNEWMVLNHTHTAAGAGKLNAFTPGWGWFEGTFRLSGGRLLIHLCSGRDSVDVLTLRPAAPHKP
jgi:hypothetical protein